MFTNDQPDMTWAEDDPAMLAGMNRLQQQGPQPQTDDSNGIPGDISEAPLATPGKPPSVLPAPGTPDAAQLEALRRAMIPQMNDTDVTFVQRAQRLRVAA
jgi:hypothetical protein